MFIPESRVDWFPNGPIYWIIMAREKYLKENIKASFRPCFTIIYGLDAFP